MAGIKNRKAQSILEYIIVVTAIVAAILVMACGPIKTAVTNALGDSTQSSGATKVIKGAATSYGLN